MSLITIEHLRKEYPESVPLKDLNAVVEKGDVIAIIGPSGCGKSTFLRCLNQLETPSSGRIVVEGVDVTAPGADVFALRRKMGMVFQSFQLFSNRTVLDNVTAGPRHLLKIPRKQAEEEAMELLRRLGLGGRAHAYPDELSLRIVKSVAEEWSHEYREQNYLRMKFRQKD